MKTIIEILKTNREIVISELKNNFEFKITKLNVLMTDLVSYLNEEGYTESDLSSQKDIKWAVSKFHTDNGDSYNANLVALQDFSNEQITNAKKYL